MRGLKITEKAREINNATDKKNIFISSCFCCYKSLIDNLYSQNTISGNVYYSDNYTPVNNDKIFILIYNYDLSQTIYLDSASLNDEGSYHLTTYYYDSILICIGNIKDIDFQDHVQTFYPSTVNWQLAKKIYPPDNPTNINISVIRIIPLSGNALIWGNITTLDSNNNIIPLSGAIVIAKQDTTFRDAVTTDSSGNYALDSLSNGTFTILATKIGYSMDSAFVTTNGNSINSNHPKLRLTRVHRNKLNLSGRLTNQFSLYQNYPNPFNPSTKIKFDVPSNVKREMSNVKLKIYDILGKELTTLVNETLQPGLYEFTWDASRYSSGIYFCELVAGNYKNIKKMILVK